MYPLKSGVPIVATAPPAVLPVALRATGRAGEVGAETIAVVTDGVPEVRLLRPNRMPLLLPVGEAPTSAVRSTATEDAELWGGGRDVSIEKQGLRYVATHDGNLGAGFLVLFKPPPKKLLLSPLLLSLRWPIPNEPPRSSELG